MQTPNSQPEGTKQNDSPADDQRMFNPALVGCRARTKLEPEPGARVASERSGRSGAGGVHLLPAPQRGRETSARRFERVQTGEMVMFRGGRKLPWSIGQVVEKSIHWNDFGQPGSYSLIWIEHLVPTGDGEMRAVTGCFWATDVQRSLQAKTRNSLVRRAAAAGESPLPIAGSCPNLNCSTRQQGRGTCGTSGRNRRLTSGKRWAHSSALCPLLIFRIPPSSPVLGGTT